MKRWCLRCRTRHLTTTSHDANTMGAAVDQAVALHRATYPDSEVYQASLSSRPTKDGMWVVELRAAHFSVALVYEVPR